jgi:hypothetical protein
MRKTEQQTINHKYFLSRETEEGYVTLKNK